MFHVEASDKDSGSNGKLEYKLKCDYDVISNNDVTMSCPFVVHQNGDVRLTSQLDRENKDHYKVIVTATCLQTKSCKIIFKAVYFRVFYINLKTI